MDVMDFGCGTRLVTLALGSHGSLRHRGRQLAGDARRPRGEDRATGARKRPDAVLRSRAGRRARRALRPRRQRHDAAPRPGDEAALRAVLAGHGAGWSPLHRRSRPRRRPVPRRPFGVFHCGFERAALRDVFVAAGFEDVRATDAAEVVKPGSRWRDAPLHRVPDDRAASRRSASGLPRDSRRDSASCARRVRPSGCGGRPAGGQSVGGSWAQGQRPPPRALDANAQSRSAAEDTCAFPGRTLAATQPHSCGRGSGAQRSSVALKNV